MSKSQKYMIAAVAIIAAIFHYLFLMVPSFINSETVEICHNKEVSYIEQNPKRIIILDYAALDIMNELEIEVDSIATSTTVLPKYITKYPSKNIVDIGNLKKVDIEKVIKYEPDLIIISGRQAPYYKELSKIAPTIDLSCNSLYYMNDLIRNIKSIGKIFNKKEKAKILCDELSTKINNINKDPNSQKKGLIIMAFGNKLRGFVPGSRMSGLVYGAVNLKSVITDFDNDNKTGPLSMIMISPEFIRETNPEYIIVVDRNSALKMESTVKKDIFDTELLKNIDAVKNNKIIYVDSSIWYLAGGGVQSTRIMLNDIENVIK